MKDLLLISTLLLLAGSSSARSGDEDRLREDLFSKYNRDSLPNTTTEVSIRVTIIHLDLDEENQIMMLDSWLAMEWHDPRLQWDNNSYAGVNKLALRRDTVWTPDVTLYNNGHADVADHLKSILVLAFPTGNMMFVPTSKLPASCVLDMTYWPHDIHTCKVKFGSWVHSASVIDLLLKDNSPEVEFEVTEKETNGKMLNRGQWTVLNSTMVRSTKKYSCCPELYVDMTVHITVQRDAPAFFWLAKIPFITLCAITCILFIMPPGSTLKLLFGGLALVLDMQFLSFVKTIVIFSPSHTPIIIRLVSGQLITTLMSVIASAQVVRMVRDPHATGLPSALRSIAMALSTPFLLGNYRTLVDSSKSSSGASAAKGRDELEMVDERTAMKGDAAPAGGEVSKEQAEWLLLGAVIDKVLLVLAIINIIYILVAFSTVL